MFFYPLERAKPKSFDIKLRNTFILLKWLSGSTDINPIKVVYKLKLHTISRRI